MVWDLSGKAEGNLVLSWTAFSFGAGTGGLAVEVSDGQARELRRRPPRERIRRIEATQGRATGLAPPRPVLCGLNHTPRPGSWDSGDSPELCQAAPNDQPSRLEAHLAGRHRFEERREVCRCESPDGEETSEAISRQFQEDKGHDTTVRRSE